MAFRQASKNATNFELIATRGAMTNGICSSPFLEYAFRTVEHNIKIAINSDETCKYDLDTTLMVRGRTERFHHTDHNVLTKVGEPKLNPLAQAEDRARSVAAAQHLGGNGITVTWVGPDNTKSIVSISGNATGRDVVIAKYDLFWWIVKRNGTYVPPFTTRVMEGDSLTVEELEYQDWGDKIRSRKS